MAKVLIVCATRTGETRQIGELIAEGIRIAGAEAMVKDVKLIKRQSDLEGYEALGLGSATSHGGAFGWSGEASDRIFNTMKNIFKMKMVAQPLRLKTSALAGGLQMAQSYGREIVEKLSV